MLPREANETEKSALTMYVAEQMGGFESNDNVEQARGHVDGAAIAVFDNYITDSPGYAGKILVVVWPAAPSFYEVFTFRDEELIHVNQDLGFNIKEEETPF